jgi:Putative transposase/Transposase zinc-binding domain
MSRERLEVSDIIRRYGQEFRRNRSLTKKQKSVLSAIELCRTGHLGYHLDGCTVCDHREISYNSCRDRHCPKCQGIAQRQWIEKRTDQLLPVPYYHVVFTLPAGLFPFSLYNKKLVYGLLFDSAAATLKEFGRDSQWLGGKLGFFGVLHTWGQTLWHHPHIHFIVAGGALNEDGNWVYPKHKGKFLFPVRAVSKVFQGKFMRGLEHAINNNEFCLPEDQVLTGHGWQPKSFLRSLVSKNWVVYCKSPFEKAEHVIKYIGRYTHKVALSNSRLVAMENGHIKFRYKDYKDKNKSKIMTLKVDDFLQRFVWHVLPEKFHRIRHYGFLANGIAQSSCLKIRCILGKKQEPSEKLQALPNVICQKCKIGTMVLLKLLTHRGYLIVPGCRYGFENST